MFQVTSYFHSLKALDVLVSFDLLSYKPTASENASQCSFSMLHICISEYMVKSCQNTRSSQGRRNTQFLKPRHLHINRLVEFQTRSCVQWALRTLKSHPYVIIRSWKIKKGKKLTKRHGTHEWSWTPMILFKSQFHALTSMTNACLARRNIHSSLSTSLEAWDRLETIPVKCMIDLNSFSRMPACNCVKLVKKHSPMNDRGGLMHSYNGRSAYDLSKRRAQNSQNGGQQKGEVREGVVRAIFSHRVTTTGELAKEGILQLANISLHSSDYVGIREKQGWCLGQTGNRFPQLDNSMTMLSFGCVCACVRVFFSFITAQLETRWRAEIVRRNEVRMRNGEAIEGKSGDVILLTRQRKRPSSVTSTRWKCHKGLCTLVQWFRKSENKLKYINICHKPFSVITTSRKEFAKMISEARRFTVINAIFTWFIKHPLINFWGKSAIFSAHFTKKLWYA